MLLRWRPSIRQHPCQGWHKSWSIGWMPNVLCELLGAGRSRNKWLLMKHSVCALWQPVLLLIMTNYVDDVSIILHYYTLLHLIFLLVTTCYCNDHYYIVITYFYIVITCYYIYHYYLLLRIHYYILLHHYYLIITSLLPHYAISKIHVIMDSLLHIITLACFIITSLLPIMSFFPIITYYWRGNLQMIIIWYDILCIILLCCVTMCNKKLMFKNICLYGSSIC